MERWDPWQRLTAIQTEVSRLLEEFLAKFPAGSTARRIDFAPQCDVYETGDALHVRVALPGMIEEDIEIALEHGVLAIRGEREPPPEARGRPLVEEWRYGYFERRFEVPWVTDPAGIHAEYADGVLEIRVAKRPAGGAEGS